MSLRATCPVAVAAALAATVACGDSTSRIEIPDDYQFASRFEAGQSSVNYTGQVFRHVLISDVVDYIGSIGVSPGQPPAAGEIEENLLLFYEFNSSTSGTLPIRLAGDGGFDQIAYNDVSTDKSLFEKIAGEDTSTDHRDWSAEFAGWDTWIDTGAARTPDALVRQWFSELDAAAVARGENQIPLDPLGNQIADVYLFADGRDLQQLVQKFLLGAIAMSQGIDDYFDDDVAGKGLLSPNTQDGDNPYTSLEHQWDEGAGYFGASRYYGRLGDSELAAGDSIDADESSTIDLISEFNFGASVNAAKRDVGATVPTDFTGDAWLALRAGRTIIANAGEELSESESAALIAERNKIVTAWEGAIAATVVHYINDTLADMEDFGTEDYDFAAHAKHWSEMKGFALGLQFNRLSPLARTDFVSLHALMGDAPVLPNAETADITQYKADLLAARDIMQSSYQFAQENTEAW